MLRPRHCAQDVELLLFFGLIGSGSSGLSIQPAGAEYLSTLDTADPVDASDRLAGLRVAHGRDQSISVERRPQAT